MHQPSRRALLRSGLIVVGAAALPSGVANATGVFVTAATRIRRSEFTPLVGSVFAFGDGETSFRATLLAVDDLVHSPGHEDRFSLRFRAAGRGGAADGIYRVRHPMLRTFDLYLGAAGGGAGYEAVVHH